MLRLSDSFLARAFFTSVIVTLLLWLLRGIRLLGFVPGGLLWLGILVCLALGLLTAREKSKRW